VYREEGIEILNMMIVLIWWWWWWVCV